MKTSSLPLLRISSSLILLALSGVAVRAQSTWNDPTTNNFWNVTENWSGGVPASTTDVVFSGTGGTVLFDANVSGVKSMTFNSSNSNYTLSSDSSTVRNFFASAGSGIFRMANGAQNSSLTISNLKIRANQTSYFADNGSNNTLLISGVGSNFVTDYIYGFYIGGGSGSVAANSNNRVTVQGGATLQSGFVFLGNKGDGNTLVISGTGSELHVNGTNIAHNLKVGNASSTTNKVEVIDGAKARVWFRSTQIVGGDLVIGKGSSLVHDHATNVQTLDIGSRGTLYGAGTILVDALQYNASLSTGGTGAKVYIGETQTDYGALDFTGEWKNADITLNLQVGDLSDGAIAGTNYDLLDITGSFVLGGNVSIDIGEAVFGSLEEIQLIQWTSYTGNEGDLNVSFINGAALGYVIREDGLYLQSIPEPGAVAFLVLGACGLGVSAVRKRKI